MDWVKTNHVKRALREGRPTAGAWLTMCSAISAEIMSRGGFDWLLVDMEHGHGDYQTLLAQLQAIEGSDAIPVVRVQWNDPAVIKRVLDIGAYGVMVPWVSSRREVEAAVRAAKYPPAGIRGIDGYAHRLRSCWRGSGCCSCSELVRSVQSPAPSCTSSFSLISVSLIPTITP